jgi:cell wall-associated NlpC family hydrolase
MKRSASRLFSFVLVAVLGAAAALGCGKSAPRPVPVPHTPRIPPGAGSLERQLRETVHPWLGTPYRRGGLTRKGVDCSGLVVRVYEDLFDLPLPRNTKTQVRAGREIGRADLRPGDLVFFKRRSGARHVGIYLGSREFAHSSGGRGVTISSIDTSYWREVYWTARRVL